MEVTKAGWKTSEFWVVIGTIAGSVAVIPDVPGWVRAVCATAAAIAYAVSRGLAKKL